MAAALDRLAPTIPGRVAGAVAPVTGVDVAAGRSAATAAATQAIQRLGGVTASADLAGHHADGRRRWPVGLTGSVAHGHGWAVALVALDAVVDPVDRAPGIRGLGIDLELARALPAADAQTVLTGAERAWVASVADPDDAATVVWCCKEAAFKAWSNAVDGVVGVEPDQVEIEVAPSGSAWRATARADLRAQLVCSPTISGQLTRVGPLLLSLCSVMA